MDQCLVNSKFLIKMKKQIKVLAITLSLALMLIAIVVHFLVKRAGQNIGEGLNMMTTSLIKDKRELDSLEINPLDTIKAAIDSFDQLYPSEKGK